MLHAVCMASEILGSKDIHHAHRSTVITSASKGMQALMASIAQWRCQIGNIINKQIWKWVLGSYDGDLCRMATISIVMQCGVNLSDQAKDFSGTPDRQTLRFCSV